ncbi:MAG: hypothetical protein QME07_00220 [bacterium]|nr:hypothetical protein [bacterium]
MEGIKQNDFYYSGKIELLKKSTVAVFCSREIPLSIYHQANELFLRMLSLPIVLAGGWQSVMEKRMLKNYKAQNTSACAQIIYFLAKGIKSFSLPDYLEKPYNEGNLLVISPYLKQKCISIKRVQVRDKLILKLIDCYLFLYINPGGHLEALYEKCLQKEKIVYLLKHHLNVGYLRDGVKLIEEANVEGLING